MRELMLMCLGALVSAFFVVEILSQQARFIESKHAKEIQRLTDSLAKCNGITARINKDSTYYIKKK